MRETLTNILVFISIPLSIAFSHGKKSDLGFNIGAVYIQSERIYVPGVHIHYSKRIYGFLSGGAGFEIIFDEHKHYTLSLLIGYELFENFRFNYSPGISLIKGEDKDIFLLTHHLEISYSIDFGTSHAGPSIGVGFEGDIIHYMVGVHFGF